MMCYNSGMWSLIIGIALELIGPVILFVARFALGANLFDGLWGTYSNTDFQENVINLGMWGVLVGSVVAPFLIVEYFKARLIPAVRVLVGLGAFVLPWALYFIVFSLSL